jgi:superfamily I DNA/RNA helicase
MAADVIRWLGGPGSGKTYQLLNFIRDELDSGFSVADVQGMTFSKSQAVDMGLRMLSEGIIPDKKTAKQQCSTIHSVAFRACREAGIIESPEHIIQPNDSDKIHSCFKGSKKGS